MAYTLDDYKTDMTALLANPVKAQQKIWEVYDAVSNGDINIVDPTSPFVMLHESMVVLTNSFFEKHWNLTRQRYPRLVTTQDELYLHMSDIDYLGRFGSPAESYFYIMFQEAELLNAMVEDTTLGIKKVVIPRNTTFTIDSITFSLQYPIEIRRMQHGGLNIVYDTDVTSPLRTLSTNAVDWEYAVPTSSTGTDNNAGRWIRMKVVTDQFFINTSTETPTAATAFSTTIDLTDTFYYARAYQQNTDGTWTELYTTHTDQVYDSTKPTVVFSVDQDAKTVKATIPQVYTVNGLVSNPVRIDVYETKGKLSMVMGNYQTDMFTANWLAIDSNDVTVYTAPLSTLKQVMVYSDDNVSGGSAAVDFETLRTQVINNDVGEIVVPITPDQLTTKLSRNGFTIVKNVDVVTDRAFVATKSIDPPIDGSTLTGISACIGTVNATMSEMSIYSGVVDNGKRITITPDALFLMSSGLLTHLSAAKVASLKTLSTELLAADVSENSYLYSPFHYVLDATSDEFDLRSYYLDAPLVNTKTFIDENDTTLINVSILAYSIERSTTGYKLTLELTADETFTDLDRSDITVQMGFIPPGQKTRAYQNAVYSYTDGSNHQFYVFDIKTNYDVNSDDSLIITSAFMYNTEAQDIAIGLTQDVDIFITTKASLGLQYKSSSIDNYMGSFLLPTGSQAITQERLNVCFGWALDNLWKRARSTASTIVYETYTQDELAYYEKDIYQTDPQTGSIFTIATDGSGRFTYNILHKKGDPILDAGGNQLYKHRKGDLILDASGNPNQVSDRTVSRQLEVFVLDAAYKFATSATIVSYRDDTAALIKTWIVDQLDEIKKYLLEKTDIFFYPKTTTGVVNVMVEDGIEKTISAEQSFTVTLSVSDDVYNNTSLRSKLDDTTITVILSSLDNTRVAISDIISALKTAYGTDVLGIQIDGLGGTANYPIVTMMDDAAKLSIKKKLVALASGELTVEENVTINYVRHSTEV